MGGQALHLADEDGLHHQHGGPQKKDNLNKVAAKVNNIKNKEGKKVMSL